MFNSTADEDDVPGALGFAVAEPPFAADVLSDPSVNRLELDKSIVLGPVLLPDTICSPGPKLSAADTCPDTGAGLFMASAV